MKYMIIRKDEYEFMRDETAKSNKQYLNLIGTTNNELENLKETVYNLGVEITTVLDQLKNTEAARKKNASKIGGLTTSLNKEKNKTKELLNALDSQKEHYENKVAELEDTIKDLEVKLEESMSDKYLVKKLPAGRRPKTQTMKLKSCTVQSNIARKMFGDSK